jgi:penicillin-binding protein 2
VFRLLAARFFYLQVVRYDYYSTRAEDNRISLVPIVPNRGLITDRNGTVLARNYSAYTLEITPSKVADLDATIEELSKLVDIQPKDRAPQEADGREQELRVPADPQPALRRRGGPLHRPALPLPGVELKARLFRDYPMGSFASHVIGYIGRINDRDLERIEESDDAANYRGTDHIGKSGLEKSYERDLHGITGFEEVEVDSGGRAVRLLRRTPAIPGNNVVLTLDLKLQEIVEKAFGNRRGALVAIEPSTGGVLALVSTPTFDPNLFVDGIAPRTGTSSTPTRTSRSSTGPSTAPTRRAPPSSPSWPWGRSPPASARPARPSPTPAISTTAATASWTTRSAAMAASTCTSPSWCRATPITTCSPTTWASNRSPTSCVRWASASARASTCRRGGGRAALARMEEAPLQAPRAAKMVRRRDHLGGHRPGLQRLHALQMAQALGAVVNNGVLYRPHIARHVVDAKTGEKRTIEPEPLRTIPFKQSHIDLIKRAMVGVNKAGTGSRAFAGAPYEVGGKTGTAQVYSLKGGKYVEGRVAERLRDHSWFIAFAPADKPVIALAVLVENGGFGAQSAAPIARQALDYYLLGKVPAGIAAEDPAAEESAE